MQSTRKCTSGSTSASTTLAGRPPPSRQRYANRFSANCWTTTGSQRTQCSRFVSRCSSRNFLASYLFCVITGSLQGPYSVYRLQLYCESCQRFLADRFVVGSCPVEGCGNDTARGDQCDRCGRLLNSTELIDPRCKAGGPSPVLFGSSHHLPIFHVLNFYHPPGL
uniref:methionine--tRNA ligase n=1 Tax=Aegilops tauschii subsp. strangulata TaxID=200361 RepID=A0A453SIB2_AEGTS